MEERDEKEREGEGVTHRHSIPVARLYTLLLRTLRAVRAQRRKRAGQLLPRLPCPAVQAAIETRGSCRSERKSGRSKTQRGR
jgi:hypothetical protein